MGHVWVVQGFFDRVWRKIMPLVPIVVGAAVLFGGLAVLALLIAPYLPAPYQIILAQMQRGDWAASRDRLVAVFDGYGSAKYGAFLVIQMLQVLLAPIPGQLMGLLGGYLFGFWHGLFLTMSGLALGSLLALGVGRVLGQQIVRKLVPPTLLTRFDYLVDAGGLWNFFIIFLLPGLPDDAVCFIAGLTRLSLGKLLLVCVLGRLPGMAVATFVGSGGGSSGAANIVLAVTLGAACVVWLFSDELAARFSRIRKGQQ